MPTAQIKGEFPNCRNHRVLPIPADGLYWGAVGIKSCLYVTHITLHKGKILDSPLVAVITGFYPSLLTGMQLVCPCHTQHQDYGR